MPPAQSSSSRRSNALASGSNVPLNNRTIANMSRRRANAIASAARASSRSPVDGSLSSSSELGSVGLGVFLCQWGDCDRRFHVLGEYANHVNNDHCRPVNRSGPGKKCEWAGCWRQDRFTSVNQLMCHVRAHTGEKPFKCTLCDLRFSVRSNYNAHVKTRHNKPNLEPEIVDYDPATGPHPSNSNSAPTAAGETPPMRMTSTGQLALLDSPSDKRKMPVAAATDSPVRKRPTSAAVALLAASGKGKTKGKASIVDKMEQDHDETSSEEEAEAAKDESLVQKKRSATARTLVEAAVPMTRQARRHVVSYEETSDEEDEPVEAGMDTCDNADASTHDTDAEDEDAGEYTSLSGRPRIGFQTSAKDEQEYVARSSSSSFKRGRKPSELSNPPAAVNGRTPAKRPGKSSLPPSRLDLSSAHKLTASRMNHGDTGPADLLVPGAPPTPPPSATFNLTKQSPTGASNAQGISTRRASLASTSTRRDSLISTSAARRDLLVSSSTRRSSVTAAKKTTPIKCAHRNVVPLEMKTLRQYKAILAELEHRLKYLQMVENELLDTRARLGVAMSDLAVDAQLSALRLQIRSAQQMLHEHLLPVLLPAGKNAPAKTSEPADPPTSQSFGRDSCATPENIMPPHPTIQKLMHPKADTMGTPTCSSIHTMYTTPPMTPSLDILAAPRLEQASSPAAL